MRLVATMTLFLRNGKSFKPGILQHSGTCYYRLETFVPSFVFLACPSLQRGLCQVWYFLLAPVSKEVCAKFGISCLHQCPDIEQNLDGGIYNFRISGQSFIKRNCHNSRTRDNIDMKFGPVK